MARRTYNANGLPAFWWLNPWGHARDLYKLALEYDEKLRRRNAEMVNREEMLKNVIAQWRKDQYELYELKKK